MIAVQCIVWNTRTAQPTHIIELHTDLILSLAWNRNGSLFATTSRDGRIRVIEPRSGSVVSVGNSSGHLESLDIAYFNDVILLMNFNLKIVIFISHSVIMNNTAHAYTYKHKTMIKQEEEESAMI